MVLLFQVHRKQSSCTIQISRKQVEEIVKNTSGGSDANVFVKKLNSVNLKKSLVKLTPGQIDRLPILVNSALHYSLFTWQHIQTFYSHNTPITKGLFTHIRLHNNPIKKRLRNQTCFNYFNVSSIKRIASSTNIEKKIKRHLNLNLPAGSCSATNPEHKLYRKRIKTWLPRSCLCLSPS